MKNNNTLNLLYSAEVYREIQESNLLIVGVGGIGCELLKVLTNSGFRKMTILDLDTIEMTNLNRQFYFRRKHVGMSKALVGKESVLKKHPDLEIEAIHGSIFEDRFDVEFYSKFDIIFCALDNNLAREQLGRMCIRSLKPMVDAGTGGYYGQANVTRRFFSQCNNCQPSKPAPSFAVCTIRAQPTEPIHCVTYAISLYNLFFGPLDESNYLAGLLDLANLKSQKSTNREEMKEIAIKVFNTLFNEQVKVGLDDGTKKLEEVSVNQHKYPILYENAILDNNVYTNIDQSSLDEREKLLPFNYYAELFVNQFVKIFLSEQDGQLKFDKDDKDCVKFVTAATNMRSYNFMKRFKNVAKSLQEVDKLRYMNEEQVRQLGGKIIPAIASTNAIAAALQAVDCIKLLSGKPEQLRIGWIGQGIERIAPTQLQMPYDTCQYCSSKVVYLQIYANFNTTKLISIIQIAELFGVGHLDILSTSGVIYGKNNRQMKPLNQVNENKYIIEFSRNADKYASQIYTIHEQQSMRKFYWQLGCRYEFTVFHREIEAPQISERTKFSDIFQQLKDLQVNHQRQVQDQRQDLYNMYGY